MLPCLSVERGINNRQATKELCSMETYGLKIYPSLKHDLNKFLVYAESSGVWKMKLITSTINCILAYNFAQKT